MGFSADDVLPGLHLGRKLSLTAPADRHLLSSAKHRQRSYM